MGNKNYANMQMVKEFAGIAHTDTANDDLVRNLLDRTTKMIERYIGRTLFQATYTEYYSGDGLTDELPVRHWPIISVTSLYDDPSREWGSSEELEDDDVVDDADYVIEQKGETDNPGVMRLIDGRKFSKSDMGIKITYVGGYAEADIPLDVKQAQVEWVCFLLGQRSDRLGVSAVKLGDYSVKYLDEEGRPYGMPKSVKDALDWYRDARFESSEGETGVK